MIDGHNKFQLEISESILHTYINTQILFIPLKLRDLWISNPRVKVPLTGPTGVYTTYNKDLKMKTPQNTPQQTRVNFKQRPWPKETKYI